VLNFPRKVILDWLDANLGLLTKDGDKVRVGCCPWCGRSRPAYVYYIPINMFRCYRCGMKANLYKLVEKVNPDCMTISQIITNIFQGREAYGIEFSNKKIPSSSPINTHVSNHLHVVSGSHCIGTIWCILPALTMAVNIRIFLASYSSTLWHNVRTA